MSPMWEAFRERREMDAGGRLDLLQLPASGGVYLIVDAEQRPILLGAAESLRRVVPARLVPPPPDQRSRRANLAEVARAVHWTPTFSPFETAWRYLSAARAIYPQTYRKMLSFGSAWFLCCNSAEAVPRILVVRELAGALTNFVGPFPRQRDAQSMLALLEDSFDLCRKFEILRQAPRGQPCEYLEMGKCPAPCDGRYPMTAYRERLRAAMEFAAGRRTARLDEMEGQMRSAALEMRFERAGMLKSALARARAFVERPEFHLAGDLREFRWLVLQNAGPRSASPKRARIMPFFISAAGMDPGQAVTLDALATEAPAWIERARREETDAGDAARRSEEVSLACRFLFKGPAASGLYYRASEALEVERIVAEARAKFLVIRREAKRAVEEPPAG